MKIEVISMWYNEEFLAPFFLNHYSYADNIHVVIDEDTTDKTVEIVKQFSGTSIEYFKFPALADCQLHIDKINRMYAESKADWVIFADADEFIFEANMHRFLANQTADIVYTRLFQVYRTINDKDLDPNLSVLGQRIHGDPFVIKGQNAHGSKPLMVKSGLRRFKWMPGAHMIWNRHRYITSPDIVLGQHWIMADPCFCIERRLSRCARQSKNNVDLGMSIHNNNVTVKNLMAECKQHENDEAIYEFTKS